MIKQFYKLTKIFLFVDKYILFCRCQFKPNPNIMNKIKNAFLNSMPVFAISFIFVCIIYALTLFSFNTFAANFFGVMLIVKALVVGIVFSFLFFDAYND